MITIRIVRLPRPSRRCPARASWSTARRRLPTPHWLQRQWKRNGSTAGRLPPPSRVSSPTSRALMPARASCATCGDDRQPPPGLTQCLTMRLNNQHNKNARRTPMRAAIFRNGEIVVDTLPEPTPAAGAVLVKTLACGICGSDLHARKHAHRMVEFSRHLPGRQPMDLTRDVVFGHEFCCEILDYGPGTQGKLKAGTRVCSLPALLTPDGVP